MERFSIVYLEEEVLRTIGNKKTEIVSIESREMDDFLKSEARSRIIGEIDTLENVIRELWAGQFQSKAGVQEYLKERALEFGFSNEMGASQVKRMGTEENYRYGRFNGYVLTLNLMRNMG